MGIRGSISLRDSAPLSTRQRGTSSFRTRSRQRTKSEDVSGTRSRTRQNVDTADEVRSPFVTSGRSSSRFRGRQSSRRRQTTTTTERPKPFNQYEEYVYYD